MINIEHAFIEQLPCVKLYPRHSRYKIVKEGPRPPSAYNLGRKVGNKSQIYTMTLGINKLWKK